METPTRKAFRRLVGVPVEAFKEETKKPDTMIYAFISLIVIVTLLLFIPTAHAEQIDMHKIMMIESGGNPNAVEKWGGVGLYQVTPVVLKEYNQFKKTIYSRNDLFNPAINTAIANWYLTRRIPTMLKHYRKPITTRNIIISYNAGISYVVKNKLLPPTTINYLKKYGA